MKKLPEWVKHIRHLPADVAPNAAYWCGERPQVFDFAFLDEVHARQEIERRGRLLPCPRCAKEVAEFWAREAKP